MNPFPLNLSPPLLATLLTEHGEYPQGAIAIRPVEGIPGPSLQEVLELRPEKKTGGLCITTHSKSAARLALEQEFPETAPLRMLASVVESELTFFQIEKTGRERSHLLGLSPSQPAFYEEAKNLDEELQKILTFFLPYGSQIRGDRVLMERCLQAALNVNVKLTMKAPKHRKIRAASIGNCILDSGVAAGGVYASLVSCLLIQVGPISLGALTGFVPSARWRAFLENALLPLFLPENQDWEVEITVAHDHQIFRLATPEQPLCADINTIVQ